MTSAAVAPGGGTIAQVRAPPVPVRAGAAAAAAAACRPCRRPRPPDRRAARARRADAARRPQPAGPLPPWPPTPVVAVQTPFEQVPRAGPVAAAAVGEAAQRVDARAVAQHLAGDGAAAATVVAGRAAHAGVAAGAAVERVGHDVGASAARALHLAGRAAVGTGAAAADLRPGTGRRAATAVAAVRGHASAAAVEQTRAALAARRPGRICRCRTRCRRCRSSGCRSGRWRTTPLQAIWPAAQDGPPVVGVAQLRPRGARARQARADKKRLREFMTETPYVRASRARRP